MNQLHTITCIQWQRTVEKEIKEMGKTWESSSSWQGIARCGGNTLLPYMPVRRKGHVRVCTCIKCTVTGDRKKKPTTIKVCCKNMFCSLKEPSQTRLTQKLQ